MEQGGNTGSGARPNRTMLPVYASAMVMERLTSRIFVILAGAVLMGAVLAAGCSAGSEDTAEDDRSEAAATTPAETQVESSTTSSSTVPTTTTTIATTTTTIPEPEAETDPEVLAAFVSEHNGDFRLDGADLTITSHAIGENKSDFPAEVFVDPDAWAVFMVLGLVDQDADPEAVGQHRISTIRGMCCPVAMWDNEDHPLLRSVVVVHELTHLADSRRVYFDDLDEEQFAALDREQVSLLAVPTEGNASRVHGLYQRELEANGARPERFAVDWGGPDVPPVMVRVWQFAYIEGQAFMQALADEGGAAAVDEAFDRPPISSEQVYDVAAYLNEENPLDVASPELPPGADVVNPRATLGSFLIHVLAEQSLPEGEARTLATAWAGDAATVYELDGERCIAATMVMDDAASASQLVAVLTAATVEAAVVDVAAEASESSRTTVELSRCISLVE